jgi:hypothetical protein
MRWEDLSELEQAQEIYSDLYKDCVGCRPRPAQEQWTDLAWLDAQITELAKSTD